MSMMRQFAKRAQKREFAYKRKQTIVTGNTFEHKSLLKSMGLRWNPTQKAWVGFIESHLSKQLNKLDDLNIEYGS